MNERHCAECAQAVMAVIASLPVAKAVIGQVRKPKALKK